MIPLPRVAAVLVLALASWPLPALPDDGVAEPAGSATEHWRLPPGPLWPALQELARRGGRNILFEGGVAGLPDARHAGLSGADGFEDALDRLLRDQAFSWRALGDGNVIVFPMQRLVGDLPALEVTSSRERMPGDASAQDSSRARHSYASEASALVLDRVWTDALTSDDLGRLARRSPNVAGSGARMTVRGIERGRGVGATAQTWLDGIPLGAEYLQRGVAPAPLERVEYLLGPRTGWDAFGGLAGALRLESVAPAPEASRRLRVEAGTHRRIGGVADLSGAFAQDQHHIALHVRGATREPELRVPEGRRALPDFRQRSLHARGWWEPAEQPDLELQWAALHDRTSPQIRTLLPPNQFEQFDPFDRRSFDRLDRRESLAIDGVAFLAGMRLGSATTLQLRAGGSRTRFESVRSVVESPRQRSIERDAEALQQLALSFTRRLPSGWTMSAEADAAHRAQRQRVRVETPLVDFFPPGRVTLSDPDALRLTETVQHSRSPSHSARLGFAYAGRRVDFDVGARRLHFDRKDVNQVSAGVRPQPCFLDAGSGQMPCDVEFPSAVTAEERRVQESAWAPYLGLAWSVRARHRLTLALRRGLVPGGARTDPTTGRLQSYRAENNDSVDLGWNTSWLEQRLQARITWFASRWDDRQVRVDLPQAQAYLIANAGRASARGGEIELRYESPSAWRGWLAFGWQQTRFDTFPLALPGGSVDLVGKEFVGAPARTANAGVQVPLNERWELRTSLWHSSAAFSDVLNSALGERPAHTLMDVSLRWRPRRDIIVELQASNLLDADHLEDVRIAGLQRRPREYVLGDPRQAVLGLSWNF